MPSGGKGTSASFNTFGKPVASQPLRMAEPMHRIPPGGVTSAASLRSIPKSCVQSVKDICMFYVDKVSGQYSNHPAAARYLHQMAEEIILQLAGVASEIKKNRGEPEMYASLLEEWEEHFPATLGAVGTPKAIATLLQQQTRDIQRLKNELEAERLHRDSDVSGILRSMDAQLHAYRHSVLHDRQQMSLLHETDVAAFKDKLEQQQRLHQEALQQLLENHRLEDAAKRGAFEKQAKFIIKSKNQEIAKLTKAFRKRTTALQQVARHFQEKNLTQKLSLSELRAKYRSLARSFNENVQLSDEEDSSDEDSEEENNLVNFYSAGGNPLKKTGSFRLKKHSMEDVLEDRDMQQNVAHLMHFHDDNDDDFLSSDSDSDNNSSISSHQGDQHEEDSDAEFGLSSGADENHHESDVLEALQELHKEKQQRKARKMEKKQARKQRMAEMQAANEEKQAHRKELKKQKQEAQRKDMAQFSRSVLSGDFSSVGSTAAATAGKRAGTNAPSGNNNNNNNQGGSNKVMRDKLLTLSATNRKLEQRASRNETLLQHMQQNYELIEQQVQALAEERKQLLRRLEEEAQRNDVLRRALSGQLAEHSPVLSDSSANKENISSPLTHTMQQLQQHNRKKTRVADKVKACKKTSNLGGNASVDEAEMVLQPQRLTMALRNVSNTAQLLLACHTPHFLEKERDDSGPGHNIANAAEDRIVQTQHQQSGSPNISKQSPLTTNKKTRMSPYITAGHF